MQFQSEKIEFRPLISFGMRVAFFIGLFLGILLGWMFSGAIGAVLKVSVTVLLLVPLVLALIFWWKVRTGNATASSTVVTWNAGSMPTQQVDLPAPDPDIIDADELELERLIRERRS